MARINIEDTIAALATPCGEGGLSVIRISGTRAFEIVNAIYKGKKINDLRLASSHTIQFGWIIDRDQNLIDQALVSVFHAPHSYTGEDVLEISLHGGLIVVRRVLDELYALGARGADPGEFTQRAFINGKLDLAQAEAVLDLIRAKSDLAAKEAVHQLSGSLSVKIRGIKDELMKIYAHMESFLDFPDEQLEIYSDQTFQNKFSRIKNEMQSLIQSFQRGSLIREGISVVLIGKPNAGKSSLFNLLLARDRALVSEYPGTTRDALEEAVEIAGYYVRLTDTAGLGSDLKNPLDQMGMSRTLRAIETGHLFLFIVDGSTLWEESDKIVLESIPKGAKWLMVINKSDLPQRLDVSSLALPNTADGGRAISISTKTNTGIAELEKAIVSVFQEPQVETQSLQLLRLRHKRAFESSVEALNRAEQAFERRESLEYVVTDVKNALDELREIIGELYSDDLLEVIFSEFCIGK